MLHRVILIAIIILGSQQAYAQTPSEDSSSPTLEQTASYILGKIDNFSSDSQRVSVSPFNHNVWSITRSKIKIDIDINSLVLKYSYFQTKDMSGDIEPFDFQSKDTELIANLSDLSMAGEYPYNNGGAWEISLYCRDQHQCVSGHFDIGQRSTCKGNPCNNIGYNEVNDAKLVIFMNNFQEAKRTVAAFNHLIKLAEKARPPKKELF